MRGTRGAADHRAPCPRPSPPPRARSTRSSGSRARACSAQELLEQAAARIDRVVPTDGYFMAATDPETTLCIGTGLVRDLPAEQCQPHWDYEFLVPDYLKYADIARSGRRVADLHDATGGRPERSPRFKQYSAATGFRSEVRLVVHRRRRGLGPRPAEPARAGASPTTRRRGSSAPRRAIARGLRRAMVAEPACSARAGARPGHRAARRRRARGVGDPRGGRVARRARPRAADVGRRRPAAALPRPRLRHARARRARGRRAADPLAAAHPPRRLAAHARRGPRGHRPGGAHHRAGEVRRRRAADRRGLRPRPVASSTSRGRSPAGSAPTEIAAELYLSPHTVRDHVKAVFEKVGVSSRGELVHRVFAEHYAAPSHQLS